MILISVNSPGLRTDLDGSTVLLDDDVMADRETEASAFARGLCCEEGIEHLLFSHRAECRCRFREYRSRQDRRGSLSRRRASAHSRRQQRALCHRIEAIGDQVEKHPSDLLRENIGFARGHIKDRSSVMLNPCFLGAGALSLPCLFRFADASPPPCGQLGHRTGSNQCTGNG